MLPKTEHGLTIISIQSLAYNCTLYKDFHLNVVETTIIRDESSNFFPVLDQLYSYTFPDSRVRLFGFHTTEAIKHVTVNVTFRIIIWMQLIFLSALATEQNSTPHSLKTWERSIHKYTFISELKLSYNVFDKCMNNHTVGSGLSKVDSRHHFSTWKFWATYFQVYYIGNILDVPPIFDEFLGYFKICWKPWRVICVLN